VRIGESTLLWQVASRNADLRAASTFQNALANRQKYLDAGMYNLTNGLV